MTESVPDSNESILKQKTLLKEVNGVRLYGFIAKGQSKADEYWFLPDTIPGPLPPVI